MWIIKRNVVGIGLCYWGSVNTGWTLKKEGARKYTAEEKAQEMINPGEEWENLNPPMWVVKRVSEGITKYWTGKNKTHEMWTEDKSLALHVPYEERDRYIIYGDESWESLDGTPEIDIDPDCEEAVFNED